MAEKSLTQANKELLTQVDQLKADLAVANTATESEKKRADDAAAELGVAVQARLDVEQKLTDAATQAEAFKAIEKELSDLKTENSELKSKDQDVEKLASAKAAQVLQGMGIDPQTIKPTPTPEKIEQKPALKGFALAVHVIGEKLKQSASKE